jgi:hypothetical protein
LQKSEKGPFCHSELVEELRQSKQLEHPSTGSGLQIRTFARASNKKIRLKEVEI